ncbi:MAG: hypothetical protein AAF862_06695 [Pseudomonadota bacterium]
MTTETFISTPRQTISGVGPYPVLHPYADGALIVAVLDVEQGVRTELSAADFTPNPTSADVSGEITLSGGAAATHDGLQLEITRFTQAEQGFSGTTSKEKAFEAALDILTQAAQDIARAAQNSLRTTSDLLQPLPPNLIDAVLYFDQNGQPTKGPSVADVAAAGQNAAAAMSAAASALTAAAQAQAAADNVNIDTSVFAQKAANLSDLLDPTIALQNLGLQQFTAAEMRTLLELGNSAGLDLATNQEAIDTENPSNERLLSVATAILLFNALQPPVSTPVYGGFDAAHMVCRIAGPIVEGQTYEGAELRPAGISAPENVPNNSLSSVSGKLYVGSGALAGQWLATGSAGPSSLTNTRATTAIRVL